MRGSGDGWVGLTGKEVISPEGPPSLEVPSLSKHLSVTKEPFHTSGLRKRRTIDTRNPETEMERVGIKRGDMVSSVRYRVYPTDTPRRSYCAPADVHPRSIYW